MFPMVNVTLDARRRLRELVTCNLYRSATVAAPLGKSYPVDGDHRGRIGTARDATGAKI